MSSALVACRTLSLDALAAKVPIPYRFRHTARSRCRFLEAILQDEVQCGHVEQDGDGGWRLSPGFEAEYGDCLRAL